MYYLKAIFIWIVVGFTSLPGASAGEAPALVEQEVSFTNGDVTLSGSLILSPIEDQTGLKPAVIFISGSGHGPRDMLRPFAEQYAAAGFVALIYDKRGSEKSQDGKGQWYLDDLAGDVAAGLELLANSPGVDKDRIGVWGISQAGWVIPLAAQKTNVASWGVVVTGGAVAPKLTETYGYKGALVHGGVSEADQKDAMALLDQYFNYIATGDGREALSQALEQAKTKTWYEFIPLGRTFMSEKNRPYWSWVSTYDPAEDVATVEFPILALVGAKDNLSPARETAAGWRRGLKTAGSKVVIFEEAGHGLVIGSHEEAMHGTPTYVEGYFETQFRWLRQRGVISD